MSDDDSNEDNNKNRDLPLRESLVNTAVNFLINPEVKKRGNASKVAFLKKKGLTESEIKAAFEQSKIHLNTNLTTTDTFGTSGEAVLPSYPRHYAFWSRLAGFSSSVIVIGVTIYGLQYFYKRYFKPWMLGEEIGQDPLLKCMRELNDSVISLAKSMEQLQATVSKQQEDINKIVELQISSGNTAMALEELKNEVSCLKSILISRHQFPAVPQVHSIKPSIPSWQLPSSENNDIDSEDQPADQQSVAASEAEISASYSELSCYCLNDSEQSWGTDGHSNGTDDVTHREPLESSPLNKDKAQDTTA